MKKILIPLLVISLGACKTVTVKNVPLPVKTEEGKPLSVKIVEQPLLVKTQGNAFSVNVNNPVANPIPVTLTNHSQVMAKILPYSSWIGQNFGGYPLTVKGTEGHTVNVTQIHCKVNGSPRDLTLTLVEGGSSVKYPIVPGINNLNIVMEHNASLTVSFTPRIITMPPPVGDGVLLCITGMDYLRNE